MVTGHRTRREGRYYEDFQVGDVYEHPYGRTITEADNVWFSTLTMNANPLHIDHAYAAQTEFGRPLVNSTLTLALVVGLSVEDISENAVANLGWDKVRLPAPVFVGDTVYAESEVLEKRESASRPHAGIVRFRSRGYTQDGRVVIEFERTVMIYKHGTSPKTKRPRPRDEA
jgi:acyl dehydratase